MKTTKMVTETVTRERITGTFCDWCGAEIPRLHAYDLRDFVLRFAAGTVHQEGGYVEGWKVEDLCDTCVVNLHTMLEQAGVKTLAVNQDW